MNQARQTKKETMKITPQAKKNITKYIITVSIAFAFAMVYRAFRQL
jgi:hypothetical protein